MTRNLGIVIVVGFLLVLGIGNLPGPRAYRERAFATMRQETQLLPPVPGSTAEQPIEYNQPFRTPTLEINYTLSGTCQQVHAHYAMVNVAAGWTIVQPVHPLHPFPDVQPQTGAALDSKYQKSVNGFDLILTVDCYENQSLSPGYTFSMDAN